VTAGDSENLAVLLELDVRVSGKDRPGRYHWSRQSGQMLFTIRCPSADRQYTVHPLGGILLSHKNGMKF
jgi:hypothetical protein